MTNLYKTGEKISRTALKTFQYSMMAGVVSAIVGFIGAGLQDWSHARSKRK